MLDLGQEPLTLERDPPQRELQERGEVIASLAYLREGAEVRVLLVGVVVGHRDERRVSQARALEHERRQRPCGTPVSICEGMHRREVVVGGDGLDERIVVTELTADRPCELVEGLLALVAAFNPTVPRDTEVDVLISLAKLSRRAMVVVRPSDDTSVNHADEVAIDGPVVRHCGDPSVRLHRRVGLLLRAQRPFSGERIGDIANTLWL